MDRWAYEKIKDGETVAYHVIEIGEDGKVETAYKAADEARLKHLMAALKWYDSLTGGVVKAPRKASPEFDIVFEPPPKPRAKTTKKKGA